VARAVQRRAAHGCAADADLVQQRHGDHLPFVRVSGFRVSRFSTPPSVEAKGVECAVGVVRDRGRRGGGARYVGGAPPRAGVEGRGAAALLQQARLCARAPVQGDPAAL
jgi:hypothetical protein